MPRRTLNPYASTPPPPPVAVEITVTDPSPPSSFDHLSRESYSNSPYTSNHSPYSNTYSLEDDPSLPSLPLHNMEPRRRNVGPGTDASSNPGWASGDKNPGYQTYNEDLDVDGGKGVYEKARLGYASGKLPPRARRPPANQREELADWIDFLSPIIYTLLSFWTRIYKIGLSDTVVWDEAHFGKFGSHYLKREFYFDVHPPLGKMLVGLVGLLSGYDGSFEFKSGEKYPDTVPYTSMRVMLALFGIAMVPLGWFTAQELHFSRRTKHLVALMVLFDNAWLTISRFILLDSMLLFFTCTTVYLLAKFHNQQYRSFSAEWWFWLTMTGLSIGCVTSVKWVGLFVTGLVGLYTIEDLWEKFGDLRMPVREYIKHWIARILCLIVVPSIVYLTCFKIHFLILNHSGPGDAQMSSLFQANLEGNDFAHNPLEVAIGSKVTLKNVGYGGGLLHSHVQTFPVGSLQQQVTCYHYKDENNNWNILPTWDEPEYNPEGEIRWLTDRSVIRLQHAPTTRMLHSHVVPAPVTSLNNEVSCYGNATIGDQNDHWVVEIVDDLHRGKGPKVKTVHSLTTRLRFRHAVLGCYLRAANAVLPQWGFKQIEVSCDKEDNPKDPHTYWNVESHWNDRLSSGEAKQYKSPFLRDFWHLNVAMMTSNNALIPDPDKEDILASTPFQWPFLEVGLRMCGWGDDQVKYYLLGNPIIWWVSTVSLFVALLALLLYVLRAQRSYKDLDAEEWQQLLHPGKIALFGWILHFAPFLVMGRVTYIHHYLPILWFAVLMTGHLFDHFVFSERRRWSETTKWVVFGIASGAIFVVFWWFRGISFGLVGPVGNHKHLQWRKSWNIYN